jgi:3-hydroxyisobutyrate dehydrogenase
MNSYASNIFHVGEVGAGQTLKLTNNVMMHMNHLIALEAVRFAQAQGVDEQAALVVVNACTGRSWVTETWGLIDDMLFDHPQAGTDGLFSMMSKDMWEAVVAARETLTAMPLTAAGVQLSRAYFTEREAILVARRLSDDPAGSTI